MDKIQKIKQEIERRIDLYSIAEKENSTFACMGALSSIIDYIDSLPEEPKKQPKFKVGDTIKGPCNNIFQVKEVLDKQYLLHSENGDELNSIEIVDKYSCISEEPANEDLEEFARYYLLNNHISPLNDILHQADLKVEMQYHKDIENAFKAGAHWQHGKDFDDLLQSEMKFPKEYYEKGKADMREEMMKDAVEGTVVGRDRSTMPPFQTKCKIVIDRVSIDAKEDDKVKVIIIKPEQQ